MMMSPESYYEFYLKEKTKEELLIEIKTLKHEIRQLIRKTEQKSFKLEELIKPDSRVRIK